VDGSDEEYVAGAECDFNHQVWQLKDHFWKLLEVACLNHTYALKHKINGFTMMKNFMTPRALSKGKKHEGDLGGNGATSNPGEVVVMTTYN
jgi:hypothetical protein